MKNILSILLFLFLFNYLSVSQSYHKFINDTLYWDVSFADMEYICWGYSDYGPWRYAFVGDTIINDTSYSKFISYSFIPIYPSPPNCPPFYVDTTSVPMPWRFMREDTINRKVYMYDVNDGFERLWYDFDAQQGDTIEYPGYGNFIVDTVYDIITNDGVTRKYFGCSDGWDGFYIEGLGGVAGPCYEPFHFFEWGTWLMCVKDHQDQIILGNNCYDFITNIPSINKINSDIEIFPNPVYNQLNINNIPFQCDLRLFDSMGRMIIKLTNADQGTSLDLSTLKSGLYILMIYDNNSLLVSKKIVKMNNL